jgi:DNA repair protein RecO (recombination protein O)
MPSASSPAIMLRAIQYGDYDSIVTFFALEYGKISLIAKGARKSRKRFAGVLELFSALNITWTEGRGGRLPFLQEAMVVFPFEHLRTNISRTAYASCWCELVYRWMRPEQKQPAVYELLEHVLNALNTGNIPEEVLHVAFQLHFMQLNGFAPTLDRCIRCQKPLARFPETGVSFKVKQGGISCAACGLCKPGDLAVCMGTVKNLYWVLTTPLSHLHRIKFSKQAAQESCRILEAFISCHLGLETKSLKLLKELTAPGTCFCMGRPS